MNLLGITFLDFILNEVIIVAMVLTAVGFACTMLAPRITRRVKGKDVVVNNQKFCIVLRIIGLCLMLAGIAIIGVVSFRGTLNI